LTAGFVVGLVLLLFAWFVLAAAGKQHQRETGVPMPSRGAMRNIRRNARKKGITEAEAYAQWLNRKQGRLWAASVAAPTTLSKLVAPQPKRLRAPPHEPFSFEHLKDMAAGHGWMVRRQANGIYLVLAADRTPISNPYADEGDLDPTDFTHRDLEDYLLTF
jgi:hypothetical protein